MADSLRDQGYEATVTLDPSGYPEKYRLFIVSKDFEQVAEAERQDVIWRILKDRWPRLDQLRLTLTLALTPKEKSGSWD